ncbi:hypothetical protein C1H46_045691 [Malus baccata]|uniref:Uncharacterized protein n=1 Tax=Malus baccata TaxID=106549 RepID=A0A540K3F1_MALBA|nr:hypothetical protein C1H46_045691 [Malus baccata]
MNYEWLDPYLGYVGSLTRMLDVAIKSTRIIAQLDFKLCFAISRRRGMLKIWVFGDVTCRSWMYVEIGT